MHIGVIGKPSAFRVGRNIGELIVEIHAVAHSMPMKARLPDFSPKLFSHAMRKPALDALHATLDSLLS